MNKNRPNFWNKPLKRQNLPTKISDTLKQNTNKHRRRPLSLSLSQFLYSSPPLKTILVTSLMVISTHHRPHSSPLYIVSKILSIFPCTARTACVFFTNTKMYLVSTRSCSSTCLNGFICSNSTHYFNISRVPTILLIDLHDALKELCDVEKQLIEQKLPVLVEHLLAGGELGGLLHDVVELCGRGNRGIVGKRLVGRSDGRESTRRVGDLEAGERLGGGGREGSDGDLEEGGMEVENEEEKGVERVLEGGQAACFEDVF